MSGHLGDVWVFADTKSSAVLIPVSLSYAHEWEFTQESYLGGKLMG